MNTPRPEHPRPQFERTDWLNLNGLWTYTFDFGQSGHERGFPNAQGFGNEILVPFCPESELSGVGHKDFIPCMWYQRKIEIPARWAGQRILLHFGGVDYESEVFVDGLFVGRHFGGTVSFSHEITRHVRAGATHNLVVRVRDKTRGGQQPRGKQSAAFHSRGCSYTRTTGIWQTVWLEAVAPCGLRDCHLVPDLDAGRFVLTPRFHALGNGLRLRVTATAEGEPVAQCTRSAADGLPLVLDIADPRPWSPDAPFLYDLLLEVLAADGTALDTVHSYAGLRKVHIEGNRVFLNNAPVCQRLVLDQGFYPDGIWTAPSDAALKRDIELAMAAGFNGARLHQKVFEERFHYWADRLGYLTWGESASWGVNVNTTLGARNFLSEWREIVLRDRNHPSIIAWSPFNETGRISEPAQHHRLHIDAYELTHALDPTRPVNDASGYIHVRTDLWTVHNYQQHPEKLRELLAPDADGTLWWNHKDKPGAEYAGEPYLIDEFGGTKWIPAARASNTPDSWGYGDGPEDLEAFYRRLEGLVDAVRSHEHVCGYCYTQLTDVEQEQNGIYSYDRTEKFDMARLARILRKTPHAYARAPSVTEPLPVGRDTEG